MKFEITLLAKQLDSTLEFEKFSQNRNARSNNEDKILENCGNLTNLLCPNYEDKL